MKVKPYCFSCLKDLAKDVASLSTADDGLLDECYSLVDRRYSPDLCPPDIANELLQLMRERTAVHDPYESRKIDEFRRARVAAPKIAQSFPPSLGGALKCSALGNSADVFMEPNYDIENFLFCGDIEKIDKEIAKAGGQALIFADNIGEFLFDLPLIEHLQQRGKEVFYAVKAGPVQNDICLADVERLSLRERFSNFISTGAVAVGIKKEEMSPNVRRLWEGDGLVISKGMGNYETISEFDGERTVIYIMKLKCQAVAESVSGSVGQYIAILGGDHNGR